MSLLRSICAGLALALAVSTGAAAQGYPDRPVKLIVPFPPGGGTDQVGRLFAQLLSEEWGQQVVVENKGGAAGNLGMQMGATARADGYTLVLATSSVAINQSVYADIPFDVRKDFVPISMLCSAPMAVVVSPDVPANSVAELVELAKKEPGVLNYGTPGVGSPQHLAAELFQSVTGAEMTHVPYSGAGPAMQDLLAGNIQVMFPTLTTIASYAEAKQIRVLAATAGERSPVVPEVPTVAESGYPDYKTSLWYAMMAPADTPPAITAKINADLQKIIADPETKSRLETLGFQPTPSTQDELEQTIVSDIDTWAPIIERLNLKVSN